MLSAHEHQIFTCPDGVHVAGKNNMSGENLIPIRLQNVCNSGKEYVGVFEGFTPPHPQARVIA